eukprot:TRINITY_DN15172_c0_g1_i4.p1 TRINITY_DN15172_c0_g1~~TRINITY_DN15172_c0_g1_i4.p1  ORF type:complete len:193 (-),score=22.10 TRINITY_DN15172_c0_g1_i4:324-848(-)
MLVELRVDRLSGDSSTVIADRYWKVRDAKARLENDGACPVLAQRLLHGSSELWDSQVLDSLLPASTVVHFVLIRRSDAEVECLEQLRESNLASLAEMGLLPDLALNKDLVITAMHSGRLTLRDLVDTRQCWTLPSEITHVLESLLADRDVITAAMESGGERNELAIRRWRPPRG